MTKEYWNKVYGEIQTNLYFGFYHGIVSPENWDHEKQSLIDFIKEVDDLCTTYNKENLK